MAIRKGTFKVKNPGTGAMDEVMLKTNVDQVEGFDTQVDAKIKAFAGDDLTSMIIAYAGKDIPAGFLLCNGAAISRTTYARLYAKIGTLYGAGDGSTTFNLPNLIERFVEGGDSSTAGSYLSPGLPNLEGSSPTITFDDYNNFNTGASEGEEHRWSGAIDAHKWNVQNRSNGGTGKTIMGHIILLASKYNSIYGNSQTVQPKSLLFQYLIKY